MGIQDWFPGADKNKRKSKRLPALGHVLFCRGESPSYAASEGADLVDYSGGGLRLRFPGGMEIGQTVWLRAKVVYSVKDGSETTLGLSWEEK